jgi:hypothetical protein
VTYRAELGERVLGQLADFPAKAFDALIATIAMVVERADPASPLLREVRDPQGHSFLTEPAFFATLSSTEPNCA